MDASEKRARHRLGLFELTEQLGNISEACRRVVTPLLIHHPLQIYTGEYVQFTRDAYDIESAKVE